MDSQDTLASPVAAPAPAEIDAGDGRRLRAALVGRDRELRSAALAVALSGSRLRANELRARYATVARKLTATGQDTAAVASCWAELWPHRAGRLRALSTAAEHAARESRRAACGQGRDSVTLVNPDAAGPARTGTTSMHAPRLEPTALAQRLERASARSRATFAGIQQGRPQHEILHHSAFARMRAQLDSLPVIEQAKGIIMAQTHCQQDQAFDTLRRASQRVNVPVRELAAQIVAKTMGSPVKPGNNTGQAASATAPPRTKLARQGQASSPPGSAGLAAKSPDSYTQARQVIKQVVPPSPPVRLGRPWPVAGRPLR